MLFPSFSVVGRNAISEYKSSARTPWRSRNLAADYSCDSGPTNYSGLSPATMYLLHLLTCIVLLAPQQLLTAGAQDMEPRAANCLPKALTILAPLSTEPAILSYCSANFPVPPVTKTKTVTSGANKRAADPTAAAGAMNANMARAAVPAKVSSFLAQASSLAGQICTCFEGTRIVTTTKTVAPTPSGFASCKNFFVCGDDNHKGHCGGSGSGCICLKRGNGKDGVCVKPGRCIACQFDSDCSGGVCLDADSTCCPLPVCALPEWKC